MNDLVDKATAWDACDASFKKGLAKGRAEASDRIEAQNKLIEEMREALEASKVGLEDWLNIYAAELCDGARVAEAIKRVSDVGTLAYVAEITAKIKDVLAKSNPNTPEVERQ